MRNTLIILLSLIGLGLQGQDKQHKVSCVAFYNFENLFDTVDDTTHWDDQFTPQGDYLYTDKIYNEKLANLSKVVSQIGTELTPDGPAILGVSEIENRKVLEDFSRQAAVADRNYQIIHFESRDFRGIDVALLYNPRYFTLEKAFNIPLITSISEQDTNFSRDILFAYGLMDGERILFTVNHWPSRRGGEQATSHLREKAAQLNATVIDSLRKQEGITKVVVMGDMNDDPSNASMKTCLSAKAKKNKVQEGDMYNPMWNYYKKGYGTTAWNDAWSLFDQIVVSSDLLKPEGFHFHQAKVFNQKWMIQKTGAYKGYPFRTYSWGKYTGGFSDHFPVYMFLVKEV